MARDPLPVSQHHPHRNQHGRPLTEPCPYCARFTVACLVCGGCGYLAKGER